METLDDAFTTIEFATKCLIKDNIDDYMCKEHLTKVLNVFGLDVCILERSNLLVPCDNQSSFIVFPFDGTSVLYIDIDENQIIYYDPNSSHSSHSSHSHQEKTLPPMLIRMFVERNYPSYTLYFIGLTSSRENPKDCIMNWIATCWFVTIMSHYKQHKHKTNIHLQDFLRNEYTDHIFITNFTEMCWDLVATEQVKDNLNLNHQPSYESVVVILDIMYQVVNCCCNTMNKDEHVRKSNGCDNLSMTLSMKQTYDKVIECWKRLNNWLRLYRDDYVYLKNTSIQICDLMCVHYRYMLCEYDKQVLIEPDKNKIEKIKSLITDYKNKVYTLMDLKDDMDFIITKALMR